MIIGGQFLVIEIGKFGVVAVIRNALLGSFRIRPVGGLEPGVACREMLGDSEGKTIRLCRLLPESDDVFVRPHLSGVPSVKFRVPEEEVIMVSPHADEVLSTRILVEGHQGIGIPLLGLPERDDILVTVLRRVAVAGKVVRIVRFILCCHGLFPEIGVTLADVEFACIPVTVPRDGLRSPMRPKAKLGVAEPLGITVLLQRLVGRLEASRSNRREILTSKGGIRLFVGLDRGQKHQDRSEKEAGGKKFHLGNAGRTCSLPHARKDVVS